MIAWRGPNEESRPSTEVGCPRIKAGVGISYLLLGILCSVAFLGGLNFRALTGSDRTPELEEALAVVEAIPCRRASGPFRARPGRWIWVYECAVRVWPEVVSFEVGDTDPLLP